MNDTRDIELNEIGVLKRREIETRMLAPLIDALSVNSAREKVLQIKARRQHGVETVRSLRELHADD